MVISLPPSLSLCLGLLVFAPALEYVIEHHVPIVGKSIDFTNTNVETGEKTVSSPIADIYIPIYDKLFASQYVANDSRTVVGFLICAIYWQSFFTNIIPLPQPTVGLTDIYVASGGTVKESKPPEDRKSMIVVLENTCDQQYSYKVNGPSAKYLGPSDMHDSEYNDMKVSTDPNSFLRDSSNSTDNGVASCQYSITVYPTSQFEDEYITKSPIFIMLALAATFIFITVVFVFYDRIVEQRHRVVLSTAKAANDVVGLHFPKHLHKELYNKQKPGKKHKGKKKKDSSKNSTDNKGDSNDPSISNKKLINSKEEQDKQNISDNFESCTVLFADLIGFLQWSRGRDPAEVFLLLETIFECLDRLTKKHDVFKVETIGDTYLAVTGLVS